jgi:hypothetical protein
MNRLDPLGSREIIPNNAVAEDRTHCVTRHAVAGAMWLIGLCPGLGAANVFIRWDSLSFLSR